MRKQWLIMALLLVPLVSVVVVSPTVKPVSAWGLVTHQFLVTEASSNISNSSWADAFQFYSPEVLSGSTTPDQAWQDWDNHLYYPETKEKFAPIAAQRWYDFARANFTLENWEDGFFALGVASHYLVDPAICVHTDEAASPEPPINYEGHAAYEGDINDNLGSLVLDTPGEFVITNISQRVVDHAVYSHQFLDYILDAYVTEDDVALTSNSTIKAFTEDCLSMALNSTLSMFYTATIGLDAPDVTITYEYKALVDYAHTNDYIDYSGESKLISLNQTLARAGYEMINQATEITGAALADVDLFIATCAYDAYTPSELAAISSWASTGNKSILLTSRGDFSEYVNLARPNQILNAIGSHIVVNHDNVYMNGTYQPWYDDLTVIPPAGDTAGLTAGVDSFTMYSPSSLYFTDDGPVLPVIYADVKAYQTDQLPPAPAVIYDDTADLENGDQIPLAAVEEIGDLRLLVVGTTFFSDFDYGKTATFDNIIFLENFLEWTANRSIGAVSDIDEIGPRISDVQWAPSNPFNDESVSFTLNVTDPSGVESVSLQYEGESGPVSLPMTHSGDAYTVTIPGLSDQTILVKIVATDSEGNTAVRAYFSVTWISQEVPPPIDAGTLLLIAAVSIGVIVVAILAVVIMKRR